MTAVSARKGKRKMKTVTEKLGEIVAEAFEACGYDGKLGAVSISDREDLCQFQCNGAFDGAKLYKKPPFVIAGEVVDILLKNNIFKKAEVAKPGFINLTLSDEYVSKLLSEISEDKYLSVPQTGGGATVVVDYGGPNVAKPLHIGHLRSAIIGESIKRLAKAAGYNAVGDIHLGDWGLQIGLVITELSKRFPRERCFADDFSPGKDSVLTLDVDMLSEVYPLASKKSKEDEEYKAEAQRATFELQNGRAGYVALWKEIMRVSIPDLKKNYDRLNVSFEYWYGESDADKYVGELVDILKEKNLLKQSEGALIVDLEEEGDKSPIAPIIIKKSDNSNLYSTTDLATIIQREKDFSPSGIWYVVDTRQELHFTQVFRCAKKAGLTSAKTEFLGFGTMNGKDGKPYKTREGGVMRLEDLLTTAKNAAKDKLNASAYLSDASEKEKDSVAEKVGIAAIKFGDLINHRSKNYIFDLDKFLSFEGKTGTYILYTVTRINSILKKTETDYDAKPSLFRLYSDIERELALKILLSGERFKTALAERAPNNICDSVYQIASAFSKFYHDNKIIDEKNEEKKNAWLSLCLLTRKMILKHLDLLAIDSVENM